MPIKTKPVIVAPDADVRKRVLDVSKSFVVQAPAGSGKTELLIQRLLALLATVQTPESVVAITFTKKAAGEMRSRVLKALREAAANTPITKDHQRDTRELAKSVLARDAQFGWNLLDNTDRLRIVTIDSLSHSLVQRMPWTAKLGTLAGLTEDASELYARAAHATVLQLTGKNEIASAVRGALVHLDNNVAQLESLIVGMLKRRDQWLRHVRENDIEGLREKLEQNLAKIISRHLEELVPLIPASVRAHLLEVSRNAGELMRTKTPTSPICACAGLLAFPGTGAEQLKFWLAITEIFVTKTPPVKWRDLTARIGLAAKTPQHKVATEVVKPALMAVPGLMEKLDGTRALPPRRFEDRQWEMLKTLFVLLPEAVRQLEAIFAREQTVDFSEIGQAALVALERSSPDAALGYKIEHLLVDEFQDTSVTQVKLIEALTREWREGNTLFVVGDPMQSIYRFRQAEVGLFLRAQDGDLNTVPLVCEELKANFRSKAGVVEWVNDTFAKVFPAEQDIDSGAVIYKPCVAVHEKTETPAVVMHPYFADDEGRVRREEAEDVAEVIASAQKRLSKEGRQPSIAVLVRVKEHLREIVSALKCRGIVFRAVEIDRLTQRTTVTDLVSLTRALLHVGDRLAWLSILRAPWCGLDMHDMTALCANARTVWEAMHSPAALSDEGKARVERVRSILAQAMQQRGRMSVRRLVEGTWLALGGAAYADDTALGDAKQYFALLEEIDCGGDLDFALLEANAAELFAEPDARSDGAVQLMSIHKAKGLEFDVVLVPQLGRCSRPQESKLLLWEETAGTHEPELFVAPITPKDVKAKDPIYDFLQRRERERIDNETRRLLYVATTRAKSELHLFGQLPCTLQEFKQDPSNEPSSGSLLQLIWASVRDTFLACEPRQLVIPTMHAASAGEKPSLRRLPADWTLPEPPVGIAPARVVEIATATGDDADITFEWASDRLRQVGIVVHAILQRVAEEGIGRWDAARVATMAPVLRAALANRGIAPEYLDESVKRAQTALANAVTNTRGRWILAAHDEAQNEFALTATEEGTIYHVKIDRTFAEDGVRWIIDYKTGWHESSTLDAFLQNERIRYEKQLQRYASILKKFDGREVRAALYYPLINGWVEVF